MAEFLTNAEARAAAFAELLSLMTEGRAVKDALKPFQPYIDDARPEDLVGAVDAAVEAGVAFDALKPGVSKLINLIYEALARHRYLRGAGSDAGGPARLFLDALCLENEGLSALLSAGKLRAKALNDAAKAGEELGAEIAGFTAWLEELGAVEAHYRKKENVLFPWFEAAYPRYRCVRLMWEIQDDARAGLKELAGQARRALRSGGLDLARFNAVLGRLYFDLNANIIREECALFPVLASLMDEPADRALYAQSLEYGWAFADGVEAARLDAAAREDDRPAQPGAQGGPGGGPGLPAAAFSGRTGALSHELLAALLAAAPVDMTVVDADDKVAWFSDSPHRIFPRSPAIVGRDVRNCHPGASVGRVVAILEAFKAGRKDSEAFWIELKGRFISIEYFALRAPDGRYLGTLEVSQDLTEKRALTGEKRLASEG
jgi:DUF438 domain-containing protein